jgi:hypothetical protein
MPTLVSKGTYSMSTSNPFHKLLWTVALGGLAGIGLGCVISVGPLDCSECGNTGCNSQQVGEECLCDPGYQFESEGDFDCDRIPGKGGDDSCGGDATNPIHLEGQVCVCDSGFNWCDPDDLNDLSCCEDDNQAPSDGTDGTDDTASDATAGTAGTAGTADTGVDTTADETGEPPGMCEQTDAPWNGVEPNVADCTEDGLVFCSNNDTEGPAGSRYWECTGGEWVESTTAGDENCQFDNFDFAFGCVDDGSSVTFVCGLGPGTPCSGPECNGCGDDGDAIQFCEDGKLGADSCFRICTEDGDEAGVTYDYGSCVVTSGTAECACCDEGDEGCMM